MRLKKSMSMLIAISMLVSNVPIVMAKEEAVKIPSRSIYTHKEIIGKDRYETGRMVLEESKRYKNIIVVNGSEEKLVDGLCASGLVEKLNATILPINPKKVDKKSMEYINKAENVYIIGENQAIPYSFEKSINKKVKVVRIGGKDRYETSEKIAKYIGSYDKAYLVNGAIGHPDAMSISSVAAKEKSPIILTKKDSSKADKKKGVEYTAIGGTSVISNSLVSKYSAKRIGGETRYETNRMVLNEYYPNSRVRYFTNGETLVDALSAASISKNNGITFINRHKNHDLLEYIDTVQVGGFPYDVVFVNNGTGTGGSGGTVVPPSKPNPPEEKPEVPKENRVTLVTGLEFNERLREDYEDKFKNVKKIKFVKEKKENYPDDSISLEADSKEGSIIGYVPEDDKETLIISSKDIICANEESNQMFGMFSNIEHIEFNNFDTSEVKYLNALFYKCSSLSSVDLSKFNTSAVTNMASMFNGCRKLSSLVLSNFNTSKVTNMSYMFRGCWKLSGLDLSNFNTSEVTDMSWMFDGCSGLSSLVLSNFNISKVTDMSYMFYGCKKLESLDLRSFNTSAVTNMIGMFAGCSSLSSVDLSSFNTSAVTNMATMFYGCNNLESLNLSNFNTSKVTSMEEMFSECKKLESLDLSNFNTSKVTNMDFMFIRCKKLGKIKGLEKFDTSSLKSNAAMFLGCSNLTGEITFKKNNFDVENMFENCSTEGNSKFTFYYTKDAEKGVEILKNNLSFTESKENIEFILIQSK